MSSTQVEPAQAVLVTKEELMRYHDEARIQGYCRACPQFGEVWSCPPFVESPLRQFPSWTHAVIVCRKALIETGATQEQLPARFLEARALFAADLQRLELRHASVTAMVAGRCDSCETCTRSAGTPCCKPSQLRYSLEAVGFDVTGVAEGLAGQKVHWPKSGIPDYLTIVGALLCPSKSVAVDINACITAS